MLCACSGKRIVKTLLAEVERKEKLQLLLMRFIIGSLPAKSPVRSALIVQKAWSRYAARLAATNQNTAASLFIENPAETGVGEAAQAATAAGHADHAEPVLTPEQVLAAAEERVKRLFDSLKSDLNNATTT